METSFPEDENMGGYLKLFVGGLNNLTMRDDVKAYFETFGRVHYCSFGYTKEGRPRGFAFVSIRDPDGTVANKIYARKHEISGKIVDVKPAVENKKKEDFMEANKKVFVGGLDPLVTKDDLREFFKKFGNVTEAQVQFDYAKHVSRCFGFVAFDREDIVEKLVRENNYKINGKKIDVKKAMPKSLQSRQKILCESGVEAYLNKGREGY